MVWRRRRAIHPLLPVALGAAVLGAWWWSRGRSGAPDPAPWSALAYARKLAARVPGDASLAALVQQLGARLGAAPGEHEAGRAGEGGAR